MIFPYFGKFLLIFRIIFWVSLMVGYGMGNETDYSQVKKKVTWKGKLADPSFQKSQDIRLEILETGDTLKIQFQKNFSLVLPQDTLWNVCFTAGSLDKCFEIVYLDTGAAFSYTVTGDNHIVVETISTDTLGTGSQEVFKVDSADFFEAKKTEYQDSRGVKLKKVVLRVRRTPKRALGKSTVSAKMIKRMPGLAEADVIKAIQGLPGVVTSSDFSSKIYVRGGSADQNLFLLDKGVVYSPVHFFGLFSTFLVEGIDEVDFYKGGFSPKYGNRLASVLDIKSRKAEKKDSVAWTRNLVSKGSLKISTFATQAHIEGNVGKFNYITAGRVTYIKRIIDFLRDAGATDLELDYEFWDLQGHYGYTINKDHSLHFTMYRGSDNLNFSPFFIDWSNQTYPFRYIHNISEDLTGRALYSKSIFRQHFELQNIFAFENSILMDHLGYQLEYRGLTDQKITLGADAKKYDVSFTNNQLIAEIELTDPTEFWLSSLHAEHEYDADFFNLKLGARSNYMTETGVPDIEPRGSIQFKLPHDQYIDYHTGYYKQYINSIVWGDFETINEFYYPAKELKYNTIKPSSSILFSMGYRKEKLWDIYNYSIESYYKTLNNLVVFAPNEIDDSISLNPDNLLGELLLSAEGYSYGLELSGRKTEGGIFGGISLSLGRAVIKEDFNDQAFYPKWHQPISFKGDLALNWRGSDGIWADRKNIKYLRSSMQVKYATGLPYTEYAGYTPSHLLDQNPGGQEPGGPTPSFSNNISTPQGDRNASFVPAYFRFDIKAIDWGREDKWNFSWTILNITDHKNIFLYAYDTQQNPPERLEITQFPFFPMLFSYEYYF